MGQRRRQPGAWETPFILPGRAGQKAREVKQELHAQRVKLPGQAGSVTFVVAHEIGAPAGVTPVVWRLLNNRDAQSTVAIVELVDWYRARWEIEMFLCVQQRLAYSARAVPPG